MILVLVAIIGLVFGSFLNALVFRTHADIPMTGRSKCMKCEVPINARDLVPVLSFLLLRGRCRSCKEEISWQYPLIEIATAVAFVLLALPLVSPINPEAMPVLVATFIAQATIVLFLIIIFVYDLQYSYILDRFTFPAMILAVIFNMSLPSFGWTYLPMPLSMLIGAAVIGGFFLMQYLVSRGRWIGGGDIRMGVFMGLWLGVERGLLALLISYVVGALVGIVLLLTRRKGLQSHIPLGTFLALGTFIAMLWGWQIIEWYLGYFT